MENWKGFVFGLLGAFSYIVNSILLPDWKHFLVGIFTGIILLVAYWITPKKLNIWLRAIISVAISIIAAAIVRFTCI